MFWLSAPARKSVAVAAARIAAILLVCGLAECAAGGYCMSDANTLETLFFVADEIITAIHTLHNILS